MNWIKITDRKPKEGEYERILIFSPYNDVNLRYRLIDPNFMPVFVDATHWIGIKKPKE